MDGSPEIMKAYLSACWISLSAIALLLIYSLAPRAADALLERLRACGAALALLIWRWLRGSQLRFQSASGHAALALLMRMLASRIAIALPGRFEAICSSGAEAAFISMNFLLFSLRQEEQSASLYGSRARARLSCFFPLLFLLLCPFCSAR